MATELEIKDAIGQGFFVHDFLRNQGGIQFDSFLQRIGEFIEFVGDGRFTRSGRATSGMAAVQGSFNNACSPSYPWLEPLLQEYSDILDFPDKSSVRIMQALYADYVKNNKRVKSRNFDYGTIAAVGSPYGDGVIYVCTTDENGFDIENTYSQTISIECVNDQNNNGVKFKESFQFKGGASSTNRIVDAGSDSDATFPGVSSDDSSAYFQNCSFSSANGEDELLFDGWTLDVDNLAEWTQDTSVYFQITPGDPVAASLKIEGNGVIYQSFSNSQFPKVVPMLVRVPLLITGVNAGTLIQLEFGEQVIPYTVTGAETDWIFLVLDTNDRSWYKKFAKDGGRLAIRVHGMSAGTINADNVICAQFQPFDGLWFAPCAGELPFKNGDSYAVTILAQDDDDAIIQRELVRNTGVYLPHDTNASAITWDEPVFHT